MNNQEASYHHGRKIWKLIKIFQKFVLKISVIYYVKKKIIIIIWSIWKQYLESLDCFCFFRTSALNGYNIKESFESLINQMIKIQEEKEREKKRIKAEKIKAKVKSDEEMESNYCC